MKKAGSFLFVATGMIMMCSVAFSNPFYINSVNSNQTGVRSQNSKRLTDQIIGQKTILPLDNLVLPNNILNNVTALAGNDGFVKLHVDSAVKNEKTSDYMRSMVYPVPDKDIKTGLTFGERIKYPEQAIDDGITGLVKVVCTVEPNGRVSGIKVLNDIGDDCANSVIKALQATRFQPAQQNGRSVKCEVMIPVLFKLLY